MIQVGSQLRVIDNSGGRYVYCIHVFGGYKRRYANMGDKILVVVQKLRRRRRKDMKVKKGEIHTGLIIGVAAHIKAKKKGYSRKYTFNSIVLMDKKNKLIGTRIAFGLDRKFRKSKHMKLMFASVGWVK